MHHRKIAIIHPSSELYGADRILVEALMASDEGSQKTIYLRQDGPLVEHINKSVKNVRIKIVEFIPVIAKNEFNVKGIINFLRNIVKFHYFIRKEQVENNYQSYYLSTLATTFVLLNLYKIKAKRVIHVHEIIESPRVFNLLLSRLANKYSNLVICVSQVVKDNIIKNLKDDRKVIVLHNGIPRLGGLEDSSNLSDNIKFYLFGRIMPKKGQWLLVEALAGVPREMLAGHKFTIVGGVLDGHEYLIDELKSKIIQNGLEEFVSIVPFSKDISPLMRDASVCLVPSIMKDPFPTTVLEAMSAGRLVIASNSGGAVEAIKDEESGLLFEMNNAIALRKRIEEVLNNPALINKLGRRGFEHYQQNFTTEIFKKNWISINRTYSTYLA